MKAISEELKEKAIYLRTVERNSINEIRYKTGISKGTLSPLLRQFPLTSVERYNRSRKIRIENNKRKSKQNRGESSDFFKIMQKSKFNPAQIGNISEAAVIFRLLVNGFQIFNSIFDGDKCDVVVINKKNRAIKIQIKTAHQGKTGLPLIKLRNRNGKYLVGEYDFLIGYDAFSDSAYIYSFDDTINKKSTVTICDSAKERWDKLENIDAVVA